MYTCIYMIYIRHCFLVWWWFSVFWKNCISVKKHPSQIEWEKGANRCVFCVYRKFPKTLKLLKTWCDYRRKTWVSTFHKSVISTLFYYIAPKSVLLYLRLFQCGFLWQDPRSLTPQPPHPCPTSQREKEWGEEKEVSLYKQTHTGREKQRKRRHSDFRNGRMDDSYQNYITDA